MTRNRLLAKTLHSKVFSLGATLILAALGTWAFPAFAWRANAVIESSTAPEFLIARQQRTGRWIEVDLSDQQLTAWNGGKKVRSFSISTGKRRTPTIVGSFAVQSKFRSTRMRGEGYDVPNVPYVMYFSGGYALHGAYWHNDFGTPVSHGCVNMRVSSARWLYNWADVGTPVVIRR